MSKPDKQQWIANSPYSEEIAKQYYEELFEPTEKVSLIAKSEVVRVDEEQQICFGWANIALKADGTFPIDWQNDIKMIETLEKAAYEYVLYSRVANDWHEQNEEIRGELIESVVFTKEKMQAMGIPEGCVPEGWWVGFKIYDPEVYAKVKSGQYRMFSIEGTAIRVPVEIEEE